MTMRYALLSTTFVILGLVASLGQSQGEYGRNYDEAKVVNTSTWPVPDMPGGDTVGYYPRTGGADITSYDWKQCLLFAYRHSIGRLT
jgi:hypothetical protein